MKSNDSMDEQPIWLRQLIHMLATDKLHHNPHLLAANYWIMAETKREQDELAIGRLVRNYGPKSKTCTRPGKRE
jgi:hypothetical protein